MTTQEAYEQQVAWFSKADATYGYDEDRHTCVYRGDNDPESPIRCAIGCLIDSRNYDFTWENEPIVNIIHGRTGTDEIQDMKAGIVDVDEGWLIESQTLHDRCASSLPVARFVEKLHNLAEDFGLTVIA